MSVSRQLVCFLLPSSFITDARLLLVLCCCFSKEYRKQNIDVEDEHCQISLIRRDWVVLLPLTEMWSNAGLRRKRKGQEKFKPDCVHKILTRQFAFNFSEPFWVPQFFSGSLAFKTTSSLHGIFGADVQARTRTRRRERKTEEEEEKKKRKKKKKRRERGERRRRKEHKACFGLQ